MHMSAQDQVSLHSAMGEGGHTNPSPEVRHYWQGMAIGERRVVSLQRHGLVPVHVTTPV